MEKKLTTKIKKILNQKVNGRFDTFENMPSDIEVNVGAEIDQISLCNSYFKSMLPEAYRSFLMEFDGGTFFKIEDYAGFKFLGCSELIVNDKFQRDNFGRDWNQRVILFCSSLGDNEFIGFKLLSGTEYEIIDCWMDELPERWTKIGNSFNDFLERLIDERGRKFWLRN